MRAFRILSLFLLLAILMPTCLACKKDEEPPASGPRVVDKTYRIVFAAKADEYTVAAARLLRDAIAKGAGVQLTMAADTTNRTEDVVGKEIFVGDTALNKDLPAVERGKCSITLTDAGLSIRADGSLSLYLLMQQVADKWPTSDVGLNDKGELEMNDTVVEKLNEIEVHPEYAITVMSQNLRCANDGNGNDIADRKGRFKKLMDEVQPDLLGTQETTALWNEIMSGYFGSEYGMVGCSRNGPTATTGEWNTILYKKSRFTLLDSGNFWLTDTPDVPSRIEGSAHNRICTWVKLKDKVSGKELVFANTHLDHIGEETYREQQVPYLLTYLKEKVGKLPLYLTGDFNTKNTSTSYKALTKVWADAHAEALMDDSAVTYTYHGYSESGREIDFCFYDKSRATALEYKVLSQKYDGFVSDHFGIFTKFMPV